MPTLAAWSSVPLESAGHGRAPAPVRAPLTGRAIAAALSGHLDPEVGLGLQRLAGNRAVTRLVARSRTGRPVQRAAGVAAPPGACATYESGEVAGSRSAGVVAPAVTLAGGRSLSGVDPESVVITDFGVGRSNLRSATRAELAGSWIEIMERQASRNFDIVGYSDCAGEAVGNFFLRDDRAWAVAALFPQLTRKAGYVGPAPMDEFLTDNSSRTGRAINRGVVIRPPKAAPKPKRRKPPSDPHVMIPRSEPKSEGCTENQRTQLSIAWPAAKLMAQKAVEYARTDKGNVNNFLLRRYFGEDALTNLTDIRAGYQRILDRWIDWDVNFQCHAQTAASCPSSKKDSITLAYVKVRRWPYVRHFGDVHVCEEALLRATNMQLLSATVLHELSHRLDNTSDHQYCKTSGCSISTKAAIDNADSYSEYAKAIFNTTM